jgi:hypothetical protein
MTMKTLIRWLPLLLLSSIASPVINAAPAATSVAQKNDVTAAVVAADDERLAAMKAGDRTRLDAIFSDDLRYAHSSGLVDNKAAFMESLVSRKTVYENFEYKDRTVLPAAPGMALMSGRVLIKVRNGDQNLSVDLNYLSVWREEDGKWRFLAWQSCRNPVPAPVPTVTK